jgi:hypothetical protein
MTETTLVFFFIFSILFTLKIFFEFIVVLFKTPPERFRLNNLKQLGLGLSLAYIITFILKL